MSVRRPRCVSLAAAALVGPAVAIGALTAPAAHATAPGPWQTYSFVVGVADFMQFGSVPGHPGNAHTGTIDFDTSDDPVEVYLSDWRCPAGKTPPRVGFEQDDGDCTQLTEELSDLPVGSDVHAWPTFSGPLNGTYHQLLLMGSTKVDAPERPVDVNVRWTRVGPVTRTVTDDSNATQQAHDVVLSAPMRLTGTIDWAHLGTPRSHTHVTTYFRDTYSYRYVS